MDITQQQQPRMDCDEDEEGRRGKEVVAADTSSRKEDGATGGQQQEPSLTIIDKYVMLGKIDRGTFSTVSLASLQCEQHLPRDQRRMYAIKMITPTSHPQRIRREALCMKVMGGRNNVINILGGFRHKDRVALVMPFVQHEPFHQYYAQLTPPEVKHFMKQLLIALDWVHQHGVIHRDVKPSNFLYSPANGGTYVLVDFGLAQETKSCTLCVDEQHLRPKTDGGAFAATAAVAVPCADAKREDQVVPQQTTTNAVGRTPLKLSNSKKKDLPDVPLVRQIKSTADTIGKHLQQKYRRSENGRSLYAKDLKPGAPGASCNCGSRPQVCRNCLVMPEMNAPRAGTPGYRPPEVLLKYPYQTTAVDVWAAGVIFLSLLGKVYPFFSNTDDSMSLAQIIEVFGYERLNDTARALDRTLSIPAEQAANKPLSLSRLCRRFRAIYNAREMGPVGAGNGSAPVGAVAGGSSPAARRDEEGFDRCSNCCKPLHVCLCLERDAGMDSPDGTDCDEYGPAAYDLLRRLLEPNPHRRITAAEALQHPYFQVQY